MAFTILPPNTPIIDNRGNLAPEWYRFFSAVQRVVGSDLVELLQQARYVTWAAETILPNDRLLAAGTGLDLTINASSASFSLEDTSVTPGAYGGATKTVEFAVDQQGRLTTAAEHDLSTTNILEGSNLYYTNTRSRAAISVSGSLSYDSGTGIISYSTPDSDGIAEGATNLYFTDARARAAISAGAGLSYNSGTGVMSLSATFADGVYTPTLTNTTNVSASTAFQCQYMRVGSTVTVSGRLSITPTTTGATQLGISFPVPSAIVLAENVGGTGMSNSTAGFGGAIQGDVAGARAALVFNANATGAQTIFFQFSYLII